MDANRFDRIAKALAETRSRRRLARAATSGALAGLLSRFGGQDVALAACKKDTDCPPGLNCNRSTGRCRCVHGGACAGCCKDNQCLPGTSDEACEKDGFACDNCTKQGATCDAETGSCRCDPDRCKALKDGCCSFGICEPGTEDGFCGSGGQPCDHCDARGAVCQQRKCCYPLGETCSTEFNQLCCAGTDCVDGFCCKSQGPCPRRCLKNGPKTTGPCKQCCGGKCTKGKCCVPTGKPCPCPGEGPCPQCCNGECNSKGFCCKVPGFGGSTPAGTCPTGAPYNCKLGEDCPACCGSGFCDKNTGKCF